MLLISIHKLPISSDYEAICYPMVNPSPEFQKDFRLSDIMCVTDIAILKVTL